MADTFKEVLQFAFEALGAEEAQKLARILESVGDASGESGDQVQALVDQFSDLAASSAKVSEALDIKQRIEENEKALADARKAYDDLSATFDKTDKSSSEVVAAFSNAEKRVKALATEQFKLQSALDGANGELKKAGVDTADLGAAQDALKQKSAGVAEQIKTTAAGLKDSSSRAREAAAALGEVAEKSTVLRKVVDVVKELAAAAAGLFVLDKAKDLVGDVLAEGDKAEKFGRQFAAAFGGVEEGAKALEQVKEIGEQVPLAMDDVQAAAIRAKKQGLDPLNGSLVGLINANAKFGGDVNTLNALIDTFGKATAKGAISSKQLVSLQQQGIPAAELLGKAIGKSADEVLRLADSGQLGRQSVATLLDALSRAGSGETTGKLSLLSTLVTKLKDQWDDFLSLIAQSGAYDFAREKLSQFNDYLRTAIADGSLSRAAKGISDGIVAIGSAAVSTTRFIRDHATAIGAAVKAYVLFRTTILTLDLASIGAKFLGLTAATKAAGAAAEAAATTGGFAKLGARLAALPKTIQIGITIAAFDFAMSQIEDLIAVTKEYVGVSKLQKQIDADVAAQREQLASRAGVIAQQLKGYADVQIASADALKEKNQQQTQAYIEQLQNAARYYNALRIQAQQSGDAAGVAAATEKIKALGEAIAAAKKGYDEINAAVAATGKTVSGVVDDFLRLRLQGVDTATALSHAFDNIEIGTPQGIETVVALLKTVAPASKDAANALKSGLAEALSKLDATDLHNFQRNITQQLAAAKGSANELKLALQAGLEAELLKLGLSAQQAGVAITAQGRNMIATFGDIADNAAASGKQIQLAFAQALSSASTVGEVDALKARLQSAFDAGKISADQLGTAMEAAGRKVADIQVAAAKASAGLDGVGAAGESAAARISGSLQDARDALIAQESQLSDQLTAALAANNQKLVDGLNAQIKSVGAQIVALNGQIENMQPPALPPITIPPSYRQLIDTSTTASRAIADMGMEAQNVAAGMTTALGPALAAMAGYMGEFGAHSKQAADDYGKLVQALYEGGYAAQQSTWGDTTGIIRFGEAVQKAGEIVRKEIQQQLGDMQKAADGYSNLTQKQLEGMAVQAGGLENLQKNLRAMAQAAREGDSQFSDLGANDLGPLISGLETAAQKAEQLAEQARETKQEFGDLAESFRIQIAQLEGDQAKAENLQFQQQLAQLEEKARLAGTLNSQEYAEAVAEATKLHQLKMKQIQEQAAASKQAAAPGNGTGSGNSSGTPSYTPPGTGVLPQPGAPAESKLKIELNGSDLGVIDPKNAAQLAALASKLTPAIMAEIQKAARASGIFGG